MAMVPKVPARTAPPASGGNGTAPADVRKFVVSTGVHVESQKIVDYGPGGVGKTKLASLMKLVGVNPLFIDLEAGTKFLDVCRVEPQSHDETRAVLYDYAMIDNYDAVILDSGTKAEENALAWTLANIPKESERDGQSRYVTSIEGYGWGKGYMHVFETYMQLLGDLDAIARRGKHVVIICHDCTATVPNPEGLDWIRWEPRLQSPPSGKASIRHRVKEWADHLLYIGYDAQVNLDGKAKGSGTRAIYTSERPTFWAKSRSITETGIVYKDNDPKIWQLLFGKE